MTPPRIDSEIHVGQPTVLMTIVVPIDPIKVVNVTIDLLRGGIGDPGPDRLLAIRGVRAKHRHHLEAKLLSLANKPAKTGFATHTLRHSIVRIIPVVPAIPRRKERKHAVSRHLCRDPTQNLE